MTLKQIIDANFSSFLRCMDPSVDLLGRLRSVPCAKDRISFINQQPAPEHKINALLNVLCDVPDAIQESVMNGFISALKSSGQEHVANIFRRESDKVPMSDEHYNTLMFNIDHLCEFIDPENWLLNTLVSTKVISPVNAQAIRSTPGYSDKAQQLMEIISRKSDDAFDGFINALNQTRQSHVAYILTGEGDSRPLKEEHRIKLLTSKRDYLVNMIDSKSSGLITALMTRGVFSRYDEEHVTIVQQNTNYDRNEVMLNLISRKSQTDFFNFITALTDTDQTHVVVNLLGADVVAKIKTVYDSGANVRDIAGVDLELLEYMREMFHSNGIVVKRLNELLSHSGVTVTSVREGCIEVTFTCEDVESLSNLRQLYNSCKLEEMLNEAFCFQFAKKDLKSLKLVISNEQFDARMPMTSEHRKALLLSEELLVDKMRISDDLLDKLSLCRRRRQAIEQAATREQQVKTLIDVVSRRPDSAFDELLDALRDTNQHEVAAVISGDINSNSDVEIHEACNNDVPTEADRDLETLLRLIRKAEAGCFGEGFSPIFNRICVAARHVAMSRRNPREQRTHSAVSTSGTSADEEIEPFVHTPDNTTQSQLPFGLSKTLCYFRGNLLFFCQAL